MINTQQQKDVERFISSEVFACQSSLVDEALKSEFFSWDDIENLYKPFDGNLPSSRTCSSCNSEFDNLDIETGECETCFEEHQEPQEIYEWWLVSVWLAEKLRKAGEPILDNDYGIWWGRCCTGQAISMDCVIQRIYDDVMT